MPHLVNYKEDILLVWRVFADNAIGIFAKRADATDKHSHMLELTANPMEYFDNFVAVEDIVHKMKVEFVVGFE